MECTSCHIGYLGHDTSLGLQHVVAGDCLGNMDRFSVGMVVAVGNRIVSWATRVNDTSTLKDPMHV